MQTLIVGKGISGWRPDGLDLEDQVVLVRD